MASSGAYNNGSNRSKRTIAVKAEPEAGASASSPPAFTASLAPSSSGLAIPSRKRREQPHHNDRGGGGGDDDGGEDDGDDDDDDDNYDNDDNDDGGSTLTGSSTPARRHPLNNPNSVNNAAAYAAGGGGQSESNNNGAAATGGGGAGGGAGGGGAKRRKTGAGSRGVATLTPEQLAKKRANDRDAQRAIRERQKLKTEQLEHEIAELKSQRPFMELQNALRQKAAAEAELAEVKRSLAKISSLIQPLLSRNSGTVDQVSIPLAPPPSPGTRYSPILPRPPLQQQQPPSTHNAGSTSTSAAASPVETGPHGRWQTNSLSPVVPTLDTPKLLGDLSKQRHDFMHGLDLGPERLGLGSLLNLDPSKIPRIENGVNGAQDSAHYHHVPMKYDWNNPTAAFIRAGTAPERTSYGPPAAINSHFNEDSSSSSNNTNDTSNRLMSMPIINCASTCPLDGILLHFIAERRQRAAEGLSPEQIVGPRYPSVSSLLNPAQTLFSHPLSKVFTDILALFPDLPLPERVAVFFVMFLNMRYHIQPTSENYDRLPSWMRPEPCQLTKPHPAWIDHLPFPRMRERLIHEYIPGAYPFEDYFIPYTTTLCVNWPYEDTDALLQSPTGDLSEVLINPVFERHLRRAENWSLGEAFHLAYPNLAGTYNYRPTSQRGM